VPAPKVRDALLADWQVRPQLTLGRGRARASVSTLHPISPVKGVVILPGLLLLLVSSPASGSTSANPPLWDSTARGRLPSPSLVGLWRAPAFATAPLVACQPKHWRKPVEAVGIESSSDLRHNSHPLHLPLLVLYADIPPVGGKHRLLFPYIG
jgi:hypothetical protein